jgi:hypothetical protein
VPVEDSGPEEDLSTSSHSSCCSGEVALHRPCLLRHGSPVATAPQQASPELGGSQGPPALSQKVSPLVMRIEARWVVTPRAVAHFEVPADQRVDSRCGECEPSII